jgi:hypothetical protein
MGKNYIPYAFYYTLAVAGILGVLSLAETDKSILGYTIKPVNILSDISADENQDLAKLNFIDTLTAESEPCPKGVVFPQFYRRKISAR